jgi:hypoxanthine phosphoribosyltransferase
MKPIPLSFEEIFNSIPWSSLRLFSPDVVIGIERGGLVLAAIFASRLNAEFLTIHASFYDDSKPAKRIYDQPKISGNIFPSLSEKKVLIVDDVSKSGKTLDVVKTHVFSLGAKEVKTFVYAGHADFSCRSFEQCLIFPWEEASK